jgi:ABC-type dipeptide/oligopeptide/nickel transport system permease component
MSASRDPRRPFWFGWGAFLGTFLLIPLWDLFALAYAVITGWRARQAHQKDDPERASEGLAILVQPIRRIVLLLLAFGIAYVGVPGIVSQPGPFGFVGTGVSNYENLVQGQECCEFSTVIASGQPVSELIAARLPATIRLLVGITLAAGVLVAVLIGVALLLHRLRGRSEMIGQAVSIILELGAVRVLASTVVGASIVALLFLVLRFQLFPFGGTSSARDANQFASQIRFLILPSFMGAMLPALISAQAGYRAWQTWTERASAKDTHRWAVLGMEIARAYSEQIGWVLGITLVLETIFAYPGIGRLLLDATMRQDLPVLVATLSLLPIFLLIGHLRAAITRAAERAYLFEHDPDRRPARSTKKAETAAGVRPLDKLWLAMAAVLVLLMLIPVVRSWVALPADPDDVNEEAIYAEPSAEHPQGTDLYGRDIQSRAYVAQRVALGVGLTAALTALVLGGLWAGISLFVQRMLRWRWAIAETLADVFRLPADAAILLHPALVVLTFTISRYSVVSGEGQSAAMLGWTIGLALTPRMAWAIEALWDAAPSHASLRWRLGGLLAVIFTGALFAAYQYNIAVDFTGLGMVQFVMPTPGNMMSNYQDLLLGISSTGLREPHFYLIGYALATSVGLPTTALYVLQDTLTDFFGFRTKPFLSRLLG